MKLVAIYTVWNALELLEGSVKQIYDHVDEVIIGYQTHSHYGVYSEEVEKFVKAFCRKHKKARAVFFKPKAETAKQGERRKINILLQEAKKTNTHFFLSATDHYYDSEQFAKAKEKVLPFQVTATRMYTYFKKPEWRLKPMESYYMPFICRLSKLTYSKDTGGEWNVHVDPALCFYPNESFYEFPIDECVMHHYSFIRKDIDSKLKNAAARINFDKDIDSIIKGYHDFDGVGKVPYYSDHEIEVVDNFFNI